MPGSGAAWYDVRGLGLEGVGFTDTETSYARLPARARGVVPGPVWELSKNTAGIAVRFVTDSTSIGAYWDGGTDYRMNHMAPTGSAGLDLYQRREGRWVFRGAGRPTGSVTSQTLATGLPNTMTEYLLYLPLYHDVVAMKLGVEKTARLAPAPPRGKKPIVFYGTSITQGGCASRSGMGHVAILGRWLDVEMINLGFSGNGRGEMELAQLVSEIDAQAYVLEPLPNMNLEQVRERIEPWVRLLREKHPDTPILLVENPLYEREGPKVDAMKAAHANLRKAGVKNLWYLVGGANLRKGVGKARPGDAENLTVDGIHPTDLGFLRMAENYMMVMEEIVATAE
jgi:lysophospholipase L1-like esterase